MSDRLGRAVRLFAAAPDWLTAELVATDAALERLERWHAAGQPDVHVEELVVVDGDALAPAVRGIAFHFPPPVRWHLALHAVFLPVGLSAGGYCARLPPAVPGAFEERSLLVVGYLPAGPPHDSPALFASVVAHESSHRWLDPGREVWPVMTQQEHEEAREVGALYFQLANEWNWVTRLARDRAEGERRVCALAASWGFAQDEDGAATHALERFIQHAAHYAPDGGTVQ